MCYIGFCRGGLHPPPPFGQPVKGTVDDKIDLIKINSENDNSEKEAMNTEKIYHLKKALELELISPEEFQQKMRMLMPETPSTLPNRCQRCHIVLPPIGSFCPNCGEKMPNHLHQVEPTVNTGELGDHFQATSSPMPLPAMPQHDPTIPQNPKPQSTEELAKIHGSEHHPAKATMEDFPEYQIKNPFLIVLTLSSVLLALFITIGITLFWTPNPTLYTPTTTGTTAAKQGDSAAVNPGERQPEVKSSDPNKWRNDLKNFEKQLVEVQKIVDSSKNKNVSGNSNIFKSRIKNLNRMKMDLQAMRKEIPEASQKEFNDELHRLTELFDKVTKQP